MLLTVDDDNRVSSLYRSLLTVKGLGTQRDGAIVPKNVFPSCVVSGTGSSTFIEAPTGLSRQIDS